MSRFGVDEDWQRLTAAQLLAAGKTFVVGYVSEDRTGKNVTATEVAAYRAASIGVLLVYEYSTTAIAGGAAKGARDAGIAIAAARALGYPAGCAIAFAVDENTSSNPAAVDGYARAFTAACHAAGYRSMDYGGLATVKRCADLGLADLHWQTYAWSGSPTVWDPRAAIRQVQNAVTIAGKKVDLDTAMVDDFGAWMETDVSDETIPFNTERLAGNGDTWGRALVTGEDPAHYLGGVGKGADATTANVLHQKLDAIAAAVSTPAPVALSDIDRAALAEQVVTLVGAKLDQILARLAAAGHALDS